jgi:hypothetical protein
MSLPALLDELERRGITVVPRPDGNISVRPWKATPLTLREQLSAEKPALIASLRARELARRAEHEGLDLVTYVAATAPDLLDSQGSIPIAANENEGIEHRIAYIAHLDGERNQRDRSLGRGYDYARPNTHTGTSLFSPLSLTIDLRTRPAQVTYEPVKPAPPGSSCQVCGDAWDIVLPSGKRLCGDCWRELQNPVIAANPLNLIKNAPKSTASRRLTPGRVFHF